MTNTMSGLYYVDGTGLVIAKFGNRVAPVTGTYQMLATDVNLLVAAGATVIMPNLPIIGAVYRLSVVQGTPSSNPITISGGLDINNNQYPVRDPNPAHLYDQAASVSLHTDGLNPAWVWDGITMQLSTVGTLAVGGATSPGPPISSAATLGASTWLLFQAVAGGYTITCGALISGALYRMQHVGGAAGSNLLETAGQAVTLARGANGFTIENPQSRLVSPANSVQFQVSNQTYEYMLDASNNVFRCMRQVQ